MSPPRNRLIAGAAIFLAGQAAPLAIPLVAISSLSTSFKAGLSGLLLFGVPEIAILFSVVVLGREGFHELKRQLFGFASSAIFPSKVSRRRYGLGLVMFSIPVIFGWISPYLFESLPNLLEYRLTVAIVCDVSLIAGLCLMGGAFWAKLRALFIYDAQVIFASPGSKGGDTDASTKSHHQADETEEANPNPCSESSP